MMFLLSGIKDVIWRSFCFQNKDIIILREAIISVYILCKSDEASFNILVTENIKDFRKNLKTPKFKSVAMATVATGYTQNIVSSRSSWDKHILKNW